MIKTRYLIIFWSVAVINTVCLRKHEEEDSQLAFVNVVFRHGDRTPSIHFNETFQKDRYGDATFYPYGMGQLTNLGRQRAFRFGEILRRRYKQFLGRVYLQEEVKARSTSVIRSKMSLLVVLAALYPPAPIQRWNRRLNWQPINTISLPIAQDGLLLPISCPPYTIALSEAETSKEMKRDLEQFTDLANQVSKHTGIDVDSVWELYLLYHTLAAESYMGDPPPSWANDLFPYGRLRDAAVLQYRIQSYNTVLTRRNGGILLHRMIKDMGVVINGTSNGKINLYCTQDITIAGALHALGLYEDQIPEYCSAVIVELRVKNGKYYVKVLYHLGVPEETMELTIPGCDTLCPFEKFLELRKHVIANGRDLQCDTPEPEEF